MGKIKNFSKKILKNQSGQGMVEYILLLVIVVALVMVFKGQIKEAITKQIENLGGSISEFNGN